MIEAVSADVSLPCREKFADEPRLRGLECVNYAAARARIADALNCLATTSGKVADISPQVAQKRETNSIEELLVGPAGTTLPIITALYQSLTRYAICPYQHSYQQIL